MCARWDVSLFCFCTSVHLAEVWIVYKNMAIEMKVGRPPITSPPPPPWQFCALSQGCRKQLKLTGNIRGEQQMCLWFWHRSTCSPWPRPPVPLLTFPPLPPSLFPALIEHTYSLPFHLSTSTSCTRVEFCPRFKVGEKNIPVGGHSSPTPQIPSKMCIFRSSVRQTEASLSAVVFCSALMRNDRFIFVWFLLLSPFLPCMFFLFFDW